MKSQRISQEIFDQVLEKTDIVDVIGDYVQLTKAGKNYKGLCPFHGENTPSFVVSPEKGIFKCFGCGEGGNAISFVSNLESLTYPQAVVKLARRAGVPSEQLPVLEEDNRKAQFKDEHQVLDFAKGFYHYYLLHTKEGKEALSYLSQRGMGADAVERFAIGLSPSRNDALVKTLENNQIPLESGVKTGILNEYEGRFYDRFKSRIMFPIADEFGKTAGFSGRSFLEGDDQLGKYVNSPETPLFQKNKLVYNFSEAKLQIRRKGRVLLFEGFLDVISAVEAGFEESVATMGTALTEAHGRLLRRLTDQVILCYDGDKAGFAAAGKAITLLQKLDFKIQVAVLPEGFDPDDYIRQQGPEAFSKLIAEAIPAVDYQYRFLKRQFNLEFLAHREQFRSQVFQLLHSWGQSPLQKLLIKQLAADIGVAEGEIRQDFENEKSQVYKNSNINNNKNDMIQSRVPDGRLQTSRNRKYENSEKMLIYYMIQDRNAALKVERELNGFFNDPIRRDIMLYILDYYGTHEQMNLQYFLNNWIDEELLKTITDILFEWESLPALANDEVIDDLISVVKKYVYKIKIEQLKRQISLAVSNDEKLRMLAEVSQLTQKLKE